GRKRIEQDACDQDLFATKTVGEPAAEESKNSAAKGGDPEHVSDPLGDERIVRRHLQNLGEGRPGDEREHEQFVGVEGKTECRDENDKPAGKAQSRLAW